MGRQTYPWMEQFMGTVGKSRLTSRMRMLVPHSADLPPYLQPSLQQAIGRRSWMRGPYRAPLTYEVRLRSAAGARTGSLQNVEAVSRTKTIVSWSREYWAPMHGNMHVDSHCTSDDCCSRPFLPQRTSKDSSPRRGFLGVGSQVLCGA